MDDVVTFTETTATHGQPLRVDRARLRFLDVDGVDAALVAAQASTPRTRNWRHRALMPWPSSERLRPSRIGSIVQIPNPI
jgi:hypothetical protein